MPPAINPSITKNIPPTIKINEEAITKKILNINSAFIFHHLKFSHKFSNGIDCLRYSPVLLLKIK